MGPEYFSSVINHYLPSTHAELLNGIVFGIQLNKQTIFYYELKQVGLLHLVVLSGMNITLLLTMISVFTHRFSKKIGTLLHILIVIIFVTFVGIQAPIIRATFMSILTSVAILTGKRTQTVYLLLITASVSLILWPEWFKSLSFYLSYAATLGLILFGPRIIQKKDKYNLYERIKFDFELEIKTSLAAQIFTVPLLFWYFRQISLISPIANALVSWTIAPLMVLGFMAASLGKIHFALGALPAYLAYGLLSYIITIVHWLSSIPYASLQF